MTDLELIFRAEKEKHDINKKTAKELNEKYFKDKSKMMSDLYFNLSFLDKYGIDVKYKSEFDLIYLSKENHYYTARIATKCENKCIGGEWYHSLLLNTYVVDWTLNSCHPTKGEYTDIEELVKAIAEKYK